MELAHIIKKGNNMETKAKLIEILNKQLGLSSYESQAYVSLTIYGPMSPSEIARKSDIPRPRTYDVLKSLMEKGLVVEQSGKPTIYAPVEPSQGLKNFFISIKQEVLRKLEEKKKAVETLTKSLSQIYEKTGKLKLEKSKVWFTNRDAAFISIYVEAIKNCEKEIVVASNSLRPPENEVLKAVKHALKRGTRIRVVRQITELWTLKELERYEDYVKAGSQVRYLDVNEIPLRFVVFDEKDTIIVFPLKQESTNSLEALWLRIPPLAKILQKYFEELWRKGKPILPILRRMKEEKKRKTRRSFSSR